MKPSFNEYISRMLALFIIVVVLVAAIPVSTALPRDSGSVDIAVDAGSIRVDPSHPVVGDMVRVSAMVTNYGSAATSANVYLYDGSPGAYGSHLVDSAQKDLWPYGEDGSTQQADFIWNTSNSRSGFHDIWVTSMPAVSGVTDIDQSNNNVSREVTLSGVFSWVVDENDVTFHGPKVLSDVLGVWKTGHLTLENATIYFQQERNYQYGIVIDGQGKLTLRTSMIDSNYALSILVEGSGQLIVEPGCVINGKILTREMGTVMIDNSTVSGGMGVMGGNVTVVDSTLEGVFSFEDTNLTVQADTFTTNQSVAMVSSSVTAVDTDFDLVGGTPGAEMPTLNISGSSSIRLTGVVSGSINVAETSMVFIYRYLILHAEDNTGLAVPYGTLWLSNLFSWQAPQCQTTDKLGDASFTVITDVLLPGAGGTSPKSVGSYNVTGQMGNVQAQANIQLPYYPTMTAGSNTVHRTIIFEPIFYQTGHQPIDSVIAPRVIGDLGSPGCFSWSGDIYVWANYTLYNIPLYIYQPSDFWAGVYIYPTGKMNFYGGGITSNHRLNVYIIGSGEMSIEPTPVMNGILNINSLVGLEDETHARGRFTARNIEFNGSIMGTLDTVRFSVSTILPHPYNTINGSLAFSIDTADIGNATVTGPGPAGTASRIVVGQSLKFTNCALDIPRLATNGNVVSFSQCNMSGRYWEGGEFTNAGSILNLSATTLSIIECTLDYDQIILSAQSFISTSTDYPIPLIFMGDSTGSLTNVNAPAIIVNDSAEVEVKWLFTLTVLDSFGTPVEGADVSIRNYTSNVTIGGGQQTTGPNGKVVFLLLGKQVYSSEVIFLGNYKAMVSKQTGTGENAQYGPYDISMRGNVDLTVRMDTYMNPLERLVVQIDNLSVYSNLTEGDNVSAYGHVWKMYKGGHTEPAANFPVSLTLSNSGAQYNGTTDGDGFFNLTFRAPPASERNITVTVSASESGAETGSGSVFNLSVPLPSPDALHVNIMGFDRPDRKYVRNKDPVTVYGNVEFTKNGKGIGVASNATIRIMISPGAHPDVYATTDAAGSFRVNLGRFSTVTTYSVMITAVYVQGNLSVTSAGPAPAVFMIKKEATAATQAPIPIWLIAVVILLVVAVVGVAAFFVLRMQSEAAKLVECGECGAFIPESALKCPKCGTEFETEVVKCSECGSWIPPSVAECPKCGAVFKKKASGPSKPPVAPGGPLPKPGTPPPAPPAPPK
jgi:ribosomal protein L40E